MNPSLPLGAHWLGRHLEWHESLPSTNDRARELLDERGPEAHGIVVATDNQTRGRGRLGRTWQSPPGMGLAMSVCLWPRGQAEALACLPVAGSLAVLRAIGMFSGARALLKWPNDVLLEGRKVCGVLAESRHHGEEPAGVVLGIGVNLLHTESDFPEDLRPFATSLLLTTGLRSEPREFAPLLLQHLEPLLDLGFGSPAPLLREAAPHWIHAQGDALAVSTAAGLLEGAFEAIGPDGSLLLRLDGRTVAVHHGDVTRLRKVGAIAGAGTPAYKG